MCHALVSDKNRSSVFVLCGGFWSCGTAHQQPVEGHTCRLEFKRYLLQMRLCGVAIPGNYLYLQKHGKRRVGYIYSIQAGRSHRTYRCIQHYELQPGVKQKNAMLGDPGPSLLNTLSHWSGQINKYISPVDVFSTPNRVNDLIFYQHHRVVGVFKNSK